MERLTTKNYADLIKCLDCAEYSQCFDEECGRIDDAIELLRQYENTELTPEQIQRLKDRDTAKAPENIQDAFGDRRLICPNCRNSVINYFNKSRPPQFCMICGQRLKWEE